VARGDLILYESTGSWGDRLIALATHGRFTHVEIDLGDGTSVGAQDNGIGIHPYIAGRGSVAFSPKASKEDREYGLKWALKQVGREYGWTDIVSNGLKLVGIPFDIGEKDHWDCSDFATRYLIEARAADPLGDQANESGLVSPNDLARAFGVV
jgi:hypothetical protein